MNLLQRPLLWTSLHVYWIYRRYLISNQLKTRQVFGLQMSVITSDNELPLGISLMGIVINTSHLMSSPLLSFSFMGMRFFFK